MSLNLSGAQQTHSSTASLQTVYVCWRHRAEPSKIQSLLWQRIAYFVHRTRYRPDHELALHTLDYVLSPVTAEQNMHVHGTLAPGRCSWNGEHVGRHPEADRRYHIPTKFRLHVPEV